MKKKEESHSFVLDTGNSGISVASGEMTSITFNLNTYGEKILIDTIVNEDSIELVYKSYPILIYTYHYGSSPEPKIWKDIYKCVDGKLKVSETIEGRYIKATEESYEF